MGGSGLGLLRLILGALLALSAQQAAAWKSRYAALAKQTKIIDGCYYVDRRYSTNHSQKFVEDNYTACQTRCQETPGCAFFGFWKEESECWLAGDDGVYTDYLAEGAVAGPRVCPSQPTGCTELPGPDFPGSTPDLSNAAWPSHRQPEHLECWPKNFSGGFYDSCPIVRVLEDTAAGWPGACSGLTQVLVPFRETCESFCRKKVKCGVFQVANDSERSCFHGDLNAGEHCFRDTSEAFGPDAAPILQAKRIMHGRVRKLMDLTDVQVVGLSMAFDENYFLNVTRDAVPACRNVCYSNIACQYWQYSRAFGCWVEDPTKGWVEYPLTTASFVRNTTFADTAIAGEYIQHLCHGGVAPPAVVTTPTTTTPPMPAMAPAMAASDVTVAPAASEADSEAGGLPWWGWLILTSLVALTLAAVVFHCFSKKAKKQKRVQPLDTQQKARRFRQNGPLPGAAAAGPADEEAAQPLMKLEERPPPSARPLEQPEVAYAPQGLQLSPMALQPPAPLLPAMTTISAAVPVVTSAPPRVTLQAPAQVLRAPPIAVTSAAAAPAVIYAQPRPGMPTGTFDQIDANHDGVISQGEWRMAQVFDALDRNHDGVISRNEWQSATTP